MSAQSFSNLANSEFNGNIVLTNPNSYIQFGNGSKQSVAGGAGGGNVSTDQPNTFEAGYTQTFDGTISVNNKQSNIGQFGNGNTGIGSAIFFTLDIANSDNNIAIGTGVCGSLTTGSENVGIGMFSLPNVTTGNENTCIGANSGNSISTGSYNCSVGSSSLIDNNGSNNSAIGYTAGENDVSGSNNTYLGSEAQQLNTDLHSYQYLTLIGANSQPVIQGSNGQIVLGSTTGNETVYIPNTNLQFGVSNPTINYNIIGSGDGASIRLLCDDLTGTTQTVIDANYQQSIFYAESNLFVSGLVSSDVGLVKEVSDAAYSNQNATIYWNGNNSLPATQQLRVNLGGTLYYINLTAV
jgi:hypothetical protein